MKLKGKIKYDFKSYFIDKYYPSNILLILTYEDFINLPLSMQWGAYQDFAQTVDVEFGKGSMDDFWFFTESEIYFDEDTNYISIENLFSSREDVLTYFQDLYNKRT